MPIYPTRSSHRSTVVFAAALAAAGAISTPALAQLRIVTMNGANSGDFSTQTTARTPWMTSILADMATRTDVDPANGISSGIAKPIDVLALQEVQSYSTTVQSYYNILHAQYPSINYQVVQFNGASTGAGTQGLIYNADALVLKSVNGIGAASTSGQPRQAIRYNFRPVGYDYSGGDIYIYNSHYKASLDSDDAGSSGRRNTEATAIRSNSDALGANKNVIYLGDFNFYSNNTGSIAEPAWSTLTAAGNGQAIDPINQSGPWHINQTFKNFHTQSPYNSSTATSLGTGFSTGSTGGIDDRFDFQLSTNTVNDGHGFAYIPHSYNAYGNNGSQTWGSGNFSVNQGSNTALTATLRDYVAGTLDHLPLIADYQLPAKMSVSVDAIPPQVITGGSVNVNATVSNSAPVTFANGADNLHYVLSTTGDLTGSANANAAPLASGNVHAVALSTSGTGAKSGNINVNSDSEAVNNGIFGQAVNYTVLDHADGSFSDVADVTAQTVDFGYVPINSATRSSQFVIHNRLAALRAGLDIDQIQSSGDTARLTTDSPASVTNIAAGNTSISNALLDSTVAGNFSATYTFKLSDQDLPGATARPDVVLSETARVFSVADFPVTGYMFLPASEPLAVSGPWSIEPGVTLTKTGPGALTISGTQSNGANSNLVLNDGVTTLNSDAGTNLGVAVNAPASVVFNATQHLASLNLTNANGSITPGGAKVVVAGALSVTGSAKVDLSDNDLIVRAGGGNVGTWNGSAYTALTGQIASGRNGGGWSGIGLVTSQSAATTGNLTTLGIAEASDIGRANTVWNGESVSAGDVLVMYTYGGDATLDGRINIDDYVRIDAGLAAGAAGWSNGDFNYDGKVNIDDYTQFIDANIASQGPGLGSAGGFDIVPVPEPSSVAFWMAPALAMLARGSSRRRERHTRAAQPKAHG